MRWEVFQFGHFPEGNEGLILSSGNARSSNLFMPFFKIATGLFFRLGIAPPDEIPPIACDGQQRAATMDVFQNNPSPSQARVLHAD